MKQMSYSKLTGNLRLSWQWGLLWFNSLLQYNFDSFHPKERKNIFLTTFFGISLAWVHFIIAWDREVSELQNESFCRYYMKYRGRFVAHTPYQGALQYATGSWGKVQLFKNAHGSHPSLSTVILIMWAPQSQPPALELIFIKYFCSLKNDQGSVT